MHNTVEMAHKYAAEHGVQEITLPKEFKHHVALFSDKEANKFPPSQPWDHKIELTENAPEKFNCKIYPMLLKEQEAEDKFLNENLAKEYIMTSDSPYRFSTFMVPKKDSKELRYTVSSIIDCLTQLPGKMLPLYQISHNVLKISKAWRSSVNLTFDGGTITSAYGQKINGRGLLRHDEDLWNQK
jgi:hypothetical protein